MYIQPSPDLPISFDGVLSNSTLKNDLDVSRFFCRLMVTEESCKSTNLKSVPELDLATTIIWEAMPASGTAIFMPLILSEETETLRFDSVAWCMSSAIP